MGLSQKETVAFITWDGGNSFSPNLAGWSGIENFGNSGRFPLPFWLELHSLLGGSCLLGQGDIAVPGACGTAGLGVGSM